MMAAWPCRMDEVNAVYLGLFRRCISALGGWRSGMAHHMLKAHYFGLVDGWQHCGSDQMLMINRTSICK